MKFYEGPYNRHDLESRCSLSSSSNLVLLTSVPIGIVVVIIVIICGFLYWRKKRQSNEEDLSEHSSVNSFSSDSYHSSIRHNQYHKDYNIVGDKTGQIITQVTAF